MSEQTKRLEKSGPFLKGDAVKHELRELSRRQDAADARLDALEHKWDKLLCGALPPARSAPVEDQDEDPPQDENCDCEGFHTGACRHRGISKEVRRTKQPATETVGDETRKIRRQVGCCETCGNVADMGMGTCAACHWKEVARRNANELDLLLDRAKHAEAEVKRLSDPGWITHMSCHNSTYAAFARHVKGGGA